MASRTQEKHERRRQRLEREAARVERERRARRLTAAVAGILVAGVAGLAAVFTLGIGGSGQGQADAAGEPGRFSYAVGRPGPGEQAPPLRLASTAGGTWDLAKQRGKTTLLYFQEGLGCQPCWDQIKDLERQPAKLRALGIDQMVSITGNELDMLEVKVADDRLRTPVLADPGLSQSAAWEANKYGMMGTSANGHSFIVVGPDGKIRHRADYGGAPDYTMYVPVADLVADLRKGLRGGRAA